MPGRAVVLDAALVVTLVVELGAGEMPAGVCCAAGAVGALTCAAVCLVMPPLPRPNVAPEVTTVAAALGDGLGLGAGSLSGSHNVLLADP